MSYILIVSSDLYGADDFGPYSSRKKAHEAADRIERKAIQQGTGGMRSYRITSEETLNPDAESCSRDEEIW